METKIQDQFFSLADSIVAYLPSLFAGIILILLGWLAGWFIKRILVQVAILIRVDRFLKRSNWEAEFSRADVRYGLYSFIGNIGFVLVFLLFFDNALIAWKLTILSDLLSKGILFLPKIIIAILIFGLGWALASWAEKSMFRTLFREEVPRASLISRLIKVILLCFFSAIALVELDVAHQIVIIGFSTIFITIGAMAIILTAIGGKRFVEEIKDSFNQEQTDENH